MATFLVWALFLVLPTFGAAATPCTHELTCIDVPSGCNGGGDLELAEAEAAPDDVPPPPSRKGPPYKTRSKPKVKLEKPAEADVPADDASPEESAITLAGGNDSPWGMSATHGKLNALLTLHRTDDTTAAGSPTPTPITVTVIASAATLAGDPTGRVPLSLGRAEKDSGASSTLSIPMNPGDTVQLRLTGDGFQPETCYSAEIKVEGTTWQTYPLTVRGASPLGLRTEHLKLPPQQILPFTHASFSACIPVSRPVTTLPHYTLTKPAEAEGVQWLTPAQFKLVLPGKTEADASTADCPAPYVQARFQSLDAGKYATNVKINGEQLDVHATVQSPAWLLFLVIAAGAAVSLGMRQFLDYMRKLTKNEGSIAILEDEHSNRNWEARWDEIRFRNALRKARGSNSTLGFEDVAGAVKSATDIAGITRPEIAEIHKALQNPDGFQLDRWQLNQRLRAALRMSSQKDETDLQRELAELAKVASTGVQADIPKYLKALAPRSKAAAQRIGAAAATLPADHRNIINYALDGIRQLIDDAEQLLAAAAPAANGAPSTTQPAAGQVPPSGARITSPLLDQQHLDLLDLAPGALAELERHVVAAAAGTNPPRAELYKIAHFHFDAAWLPVPTVTSMPASSKVLVESGADPASESIHALRAITFVLATTPPLDASRYGVQWKVGSDVSVGGPRYTHVFGKHDKKATVVAALVESATSTVLSHPTTPWSGTVKKPSSETRRFRYYLWLTEMSFTGVGVIVASAIAVWVQLAGKPLGSTADLLTLLAAGFGIDVTLGGGMGSMLATLVSNVTGRSAEPAAKS